MSHNEVDLGILEIGTRVLLSVYAAATIALWIWGIFLLNKHIVHRVFHNFMLTAGIRPPKTNATVKGQIGNKRRRKSRR